MDLRSGYNLSLMPQYESASLHCPELSWLICNHTFLTYFWQLTDTYAVIVNVRDHNEQLTVEAFGASFRNQKVVRPTTAAEIKLGQLGPTLGTRSVQIPVRSLKRNGHWRVHRVASDCILSLFHWNLPSWTRVVCIKKSHLQLTLNRSNSMNINLWSLNSHGLPLSSNLGARKILQVPSLAALLWTPIR